MTPQHNNLNLLRALAVVAVFAHHAQHYLSLPLGWPGVYGGLLGVQLFFLVSGYLIVQSAERQPWRPYLVARAFRIFPTYWVALLAVSWGVSHTLPLANADDWPAFAANFFTLGHVVPSALVKFDVLTVGWTLTIEWSWYLLAPLLVAAVAWASRRGLAPCWAWLGLAGLALGVSVAWVLAAQAGRLDGLYAANIARLGLGPINEHLRTAFVVVAAPAQWVFFLLGVVLWVWRDALARLPLAVLLGVALALLFRPAWWPPLLGFDPSLATGLGLAAVFLLVLRLPPGGAQHRLGRVVHGLAHRLGDWSYPIYLVHVPVMAVVLGRLGLAGWPALAAAGSGTLLVAWALHHAVENPGRRLGAWCLRRRAVAGNPQPG